MFLPRSLIDLDSVLSPAVARALALVFALRTRIGSCAFYFPHGLVLWGSLGRRRDISGGFLSV